MAYGMKGLNLIQLFEFLATSHKTCIVMVDMMQGCCALDRKEKPKIASSLLRT